MWETVLTLGVFMTAPSGERRVPGAGSARKLLLMLLCFSSERPTWTVPDLAEELSLSLSSAYRYVAVLREVGLLDSASESSYRLTGRTFGLARAAEAAQAPLVDVALPVMTRLRDEIDETVLIAQRSGTTVFCVDRVESRQPVRLQYDRGQPMPLHAGSLARVLLAFMPTAERDHFLRELLPSLPRSQQLLLTPEKLAQVRTMGWTESSGEVDAGIWGTASAIVVHERVVASIGTAAPDFRLDEHKRQQARRLVQDAARQVSRALEQFN